MKSFGIKKSHKMAELYTTAPSKRDSYMDDNVMLYGLDINDKDSKKGPKGGLSIRTTEASRADYY